MKIKSKVIVQLSISIVLLSACAPTEGYTDQFPKHVTDVIEAFEQGGYFCEDPTVYLTSGSIFVNSDSNPDKLTCNESDSNILGDEFYIFASEEEAASYFQQSCNDREGGWWIGDFMISPTVRMEEFEKTLDLANNLARALGYSKAQEIGVTCEYSDLNW